MRGSRLWIVSSCVVAMGIVACGDGSSNPGDRLTAPASIEIIAGTEQTAVVGTELPQALSVRVTDGAGRSVSGINVAWMVTTGGGTVSPTSSATDIGGIASTRWTLGTIPGSNTLTATVVGLPAATFSANALANDATASVTVTSPTLTPYEGDTVQLTAMARDAYGNELPGKVAAWSSSDSTIAPISESGLMQAWGTGEVTVSATVDGVVGTATLSLTPILATVTFGARAIVFDWTTDRCEDLDVPDGPAIFVRTADGRLTLFDGNAPRYFVSRGADFDSVRRDCTEPALVSLDDWTPQSYQNWEWLWAVYREGSTWHALVHNEFHDPQAATCAPGDTSPGNPCWYNSVTYAVSTDGAFSFFKPGAAGHTVAPAPYAWVPPDSGSQPEGNGFVEGYFNPSNVIQGNDGYYYSFLMAIPTQNWIAPQGRCILRTRALGDPSSWRAWDGSGFNLQMTSPYVTGQPAPVCGFLKTSLSMGQVAHSTYLERYVYLAAAIAMHEGRVTCGLFFELSSDLIHWSEPQLISQAQLPWCQPDGSQPLIEPAVVAYPSLVDHADTTVNFEQIGRTPYLYYTRFNDGGLDRDLVRVQLTFTRTN